MAMSCGPEGPQETDPVKLSVDKTSLELAAEGGRRLQRLLSCKMGYS